MGGGTESTTAPGMYWPGVGWLQAGSPAHGTKAAPLLLASSVKLCRAPTQTIEVALPMALHGRLTVAVLPLIVPLVPVGAPVGVQEEPTGPTFATNVPCAVWAYCAA